jgi:hypothetical protein
MGNNGKSTKRSHPHMKAVVFVITAFVIAAAVTGGLLLCTCGSGSHTTGPPKAAIVDQLSLTVPNPDFVSSTRSVLEEAGYVVDYYSGEQVTVPFYRDLPSLGYDLIILRVHSNISMVMVTATTAVMGNLALFTGEPFTENKYQDEGVGRGTTYNERGEFSSWKFVVGGSFVEKSIRGRFNKTIVILMGCEGLKSPTTAQAFLDRGAEAVVGWTEAVESNHTDTATLRLLQKFLREGHTIEDAVAQTAAEVGPDPFSNAELQIMSSIQ